jgi:hypothetical protein
VTQHGTPITSQPHASRLSRRAFVFGAAAAAATMGTGSALVRASSALAGSASGSRSQRFRSALSVSPFTETVLGGGVTLTDGRRTAATTGQVQLMFLAHGATEVYARIGTPRDDRVRGAEMGLDRGLERARLARRLDIPFNPELGLWGTYGDISSGQPAPDFSDFPSISLPGPWSSLTIDQMEPPLRQYGAIAAREILRTGVDVDVWDIGNEPEFGLAGVAVRPPSGGPYTPPDAVDPAIGAMGWVTLLRMPDANRIAWLQAHVWPHVGRLLRAVADGIRSVDRGARFSTHVSGIFVYAPSQMAEAFYAAMDEAGFRADQLGMSYYPTAIENGLDRLAAAQQTIQSLRAGLGRRIFVAEFGYPSSTMGPPFAWNATLTGYPESPQGQYSFLKDLVSWGRTTGNLSGIRPWAPDYLTSFWQPMSLFARVGSQGVAQPGLDAIADGLDAAGEAGGLVDRLNNE